MSFKKIKRDVRRCRPEMMKCPNPENPVIHDECICPGCGELHIMKIH